MRKIASAKVRVEVGEKVVAEFAIDPASAKNDVTTEASSYAVLASSFGQSVNVDWVNLIGFGIGARFCAVEDIIR